MTNHSPLLGYEEVEHTADWAYRVWGQNLPELFTQATLGLYYLAGAELGEQERVNKEIELRGIDPESLLVAWLNELLHLHESENLGCDTLEIVKLEPTILQVKLTLAPVTSWLKDIKAATYHNLAIIKTETGVEATLVLDV